MDDLSEMENLVVKWEATQLLIECKDLPEKIQLATLLNEMAENIVRQYTDESDEDSQIKAGILIPLVVGIFYEGVHDIKIDRVISIVDASFPILKEFKANNITEIDAEAEFADLCKEKYIETEN